MSINSKVPSPLVSAIVPTYNSAKFLPGLLDSLVNQSIGDQLEIIIVDTDSQTNEWEIIKPYLDKYTNISYVRTSFRESAAAATNKGIQLAKGKYIIPAPTDDRLRVDALEVMTNELENNPDISLVYADVFMTMLENQTFAHHIRYGFSIRFDYALDIMMTGYTMGPLIMWKRSLHDLVGYFDDSYLCANDYDFHCRVALQASMKHIPRFLGLYLRNTEGIVFSNSVTSAKEFSTIQKSYQDKFPSPIATPFPINFYGEKLSPEKYVNICMVTYNRLEFTKSSITSIVQFTCFPHVLTVVDNGSTDGTVEYLQTMKKEGIITNLILLKENVGVAKASNLAWSQEPEAEYYMKFDNDIVIQKPHWLENMVEVIDAISDLGMVGYNFEPCSYPSEAINGKNIRRKKGNVGGACVLIPKRTQQKLGFWCEDYGLYGEEDADYGLRIRLKGLLSAYMEDEQIGIHLPAGRAAHIDEKTLRATDGVEEDIHVEYRMFKDACRQKNVHESLHKFAQEYETGMRPLCCTSQFVEKFQKEETPSDSGERLKDFSSENRGEISGEPHLPYTSNQGVFSHGSSLKFQEPSPFECSIIIPVFNKLELTRQCLTSLAEVTKECVYEVIVVDNASTDGTRQFLSSLEGDIQCIINETNLGFAKACNQGARAARGTHLVFLNNDTIPRAGWLKALIQEVDTHSDVDVVGSKLLYPDDTIQHAGVVFSRILQLPYHLFCGVPENFSGVNARKEFQAVTAACMLVRKETFGKVGGFDEGFVNGFEDVDLCLKVGQLGKKIVYQPKSCLYHLESQSPGRKDHEDTNTRRLLARWRHRWLVDEDIYTVPEGLIMKVYQKDGQLCYRTDALPSGEQGAAWHRVAQVQRILLAHNKATDHLQGADHDCELKRLLSIPSEWPDDVEVLRWAIFICQRLQWTDSIPNFARKILCLAEDQECQERLAKAALEIGDLNEAKIHLDMIFAHHQPGSSGYILQGVLAMQEQRFSDAFQYFEQAISLTPQDRKACVGLGMAAMGLENYSRAWDSFQQVLLENPDDAEAIHWLLRAGTALENWAALDQRLKKFLERNPADCEVRYALVGILIRLGDCASAKTELSMLQALKPDFEGLGELEQALFSSLESQKPSVQIHLLKDKYAPFFEQVKIQSYFQPPVGSTESFIQVRPINIHSHTVAVYQFLKNYSIDGFGFGVSAIRKILPVVFERQFPNSRFNGRDIWDSVIVLSLDCELNHRATNQPFLKLECSVLSQLGEEFLAGEGEGRKSDILNYIETISNGEQLGEPLYISGALLNILGANTDSKAMYMLDGARRLAAMALRGGGEARIHLLIFEEEFAALLDSSCRSTIQEKIGQLSWFSNYHTFPFLGIKGHRSLRRFELMDRAQLQDAVILDFGCNLGQASLKAIQYGAKEVWGIEGMPDTLVIAEEIKEIASYEGLRYLQVDFNDQYFDQQIDRHIPGLCDYSFFFSVYRTKELIQRDRLFQYILMKTQKGVFFEGHAHPKIDTIDYYEWLFESFNVPFTFLGFSEEQIRPLFFLNLAERSIQQKTWDLQSTPGLQALDSTRRLSQEDHLITK